MVWKALLTVLAVTTLLLCLFTAVADVVLPSCTTVGTALSTPDVSVNLSCTSVTFSNVVINGNMTLNISITGIVAANPSSPNITITISNVTLQAGATLAIDSREYAAPGGGPTASIMIQSLTGNDGCLVFLGSFPPGTAILVIGAQMTSSTTAAPTLSALDTSYTSVHTLVALVNVSLTSNSSMTFANSSLSSTSTNQTFPFHTILPTTFSNGSTLTLLNCTMSTGNGYTVYMSNSVAFSTSSSFVVRSCNLTADATDAFSTEENPVTFTNSSYFCLTASAILSLGGHAFFTSTAVFTSSSYLVVSLCTMTAQGGSAFYIYRATFTSSSYLALSSCTATAGGGNHAFFLDRSVFTGSSFLKLSSCTTTAEGNAFSLTAVNFTDSSFLAVNSSNMSGSFAFSVDAMSVDGWSYVIVTNSSFSSTTDGPVTLSSNIPLVIGNSSWVLWKGNVMNSINGSGSCIESDFTFSDSTTTASPGTISILDNACTCGLGCSFWNTSSESSGAGGKIYQRCNTVNGVAAESPLLPKGAISAGACGSCSASADCFGPLTLTNRKCASTGLKSVACQCLPGGVANNMCLPPSLLYPWSPAARMMTSPSASLSTVSPSLSCPVNMDLMQDAIAEVSNSIFQLGALIPVVLLVSSSGEIAVRVRAAPGVTFAAAGNATGSIGGPWLVPPQSDKNGNSSLLVLESAALKNIGGQLSLVDASLLAITFDVVVADGICLPAGYSRRMQLVWTLLPLPPPTALEAATQTTVRAASVTSSMIGDPLTAMSTISMISLLSLSGCVFSDVDPLETAVNPTGVGLGPQVGQYYRGGAAVAVILYASLVAIGVFGAFTLSTWKKQPLASSFARLRFPSMGMVIVGLFGQGLASCGMSLIRLGASSEDIALGVVALTICLVIAVGAGYITTFGLKCDLAKSEDTAANAVAFPKAVKAFLSIGNWDMHWKDKPGAAEFSVRYMLLLNKLHLPWWTAVELSSCLAQGALLGIRYNSLEMCRAQRWVLTIITAAMAAGAIYLRPYGLRLNNGFLILSKVGTFAVALMVLLRSLTLDDTFGSAAQIFATLSTGIDSCQTLVKVILLGLRGVQLVYLRRRTSANGLPAAAMEEVKQATLIVPTDEMIPPHGVLDPMRYDSQPRSVERDAMWSRLALARHASAQQKWNELLRYLIEALNPATPYQSRLMLLVQAACVARGNPSSLNDAML